MPNGSGGELGRTSPRGFRDVGMKLGGYARHSSCADSSLGCNSPNRKVQIKQRQYFISFSRGEGPHDVGDVESRGI